MRGREGANVAEERDVRSPATVIWHLVRAQFKDAMSKLNKGPAQDSGSSFQDSGSSFSSGWRTA